MYGYPDSGIQEILHVESRNPGFEIPNTAQGIRNSIIKRNLESMAWNLESNTVLRLLTWYDPASFDIK